MISQNQIKHLRSLGIKKHRLEQGQFLIEGDKMVAELLGQSHIGISAVFALESWVEKNDRFLRSVSGKVFTVSEAELAKISNLSTPNQVLALANIPLDACNFQLATTNICFYLDGIQDPGNMGSILRIADWFGMPAVYCSPDCVDVYSPKVVQASMGALFRVQTWELELAKILNETSFIPVAGAVLDGKNIFEEKLPQNGLIVIGNEGRGISNHVTALLTHRISIPRHPNGGAESLNAAVAAGILAAVFRNDRVME
jgi:TrmH family RNA methyltransferase